MAGDPGTLHLELAMRGFRARRSVVCRRVDRDDGVALLRRHPESVRTEGSDIP